MGAQVNGAASIIRSTRNICRMVGRFGLAGITARTSPEYAAAVAALVLACQTFEALDETPYQVDRVPPRGPEDEDGPSG